MRKYVKIVIIILVLVNMFYIWKQLTLSVKYNDRITIDNRIINNKNRLIEHLDDLFYGKYSNLYLSLESFDTIHIKEEKFVLYVSEGNCQSCIIEISNYLEKLSSIIGKNRIVIIGNFKTDENFESLINKLTFPIECKIYSNTPCLPGELNNQIALFTIDKELKISNLYIPDYQINLRDKYFNETIPKYFKNNKNFNLVTGGIKYSK